MKFRYSAAGPDGDVLVGFVEADDEAAARHQLQARGIQPELIEPAADDSAAVVPEKQTSARLTRSEQTEAIGQIGDIISVGIPLSAGLWTLAEEMPSKRSRAVFRSMSLQLDEGHSLDDVLSGHADSLPRWLSAVLKSGAETGRVAESVRHYVQFTRLRSAQLGRLAVCLLYPAILVLAALVMTGFLLMGLLPMFRKIFEDFGTQLPGATEAMFNISDIVVPLIEDWYITVPVMIVVFTVTRSLLRTFIGPSGLRRLLYEVPIIGQMMKFTALSEFCHLLALLVENQTPLPRAFDLVSQGVRDPNLSLGAAEAAAQLTRGIPATRLRAFVPELPDELLRIPGWESGERDLADSLRAASDVFCIQSEVTARSIAGFVAPVAVLAVAIGVGFFVLAMFMPLVSLLNDLS
jgi:type IV pilus assembly protein PilC